MIVLLSVRADVSQAPRFRRLLPDSLLWVMRLSETRVLRDHGLSMRPSPRIKPLLSWRHVAHRCRRKRPRRARVGSRIFLWLARNAAERRLERGRGQRDRRVQSRLLAFLDYNGTGSWDGPTKDKVYTFGWPGATPVIGDWNGDRKAKIGTFLNNQWRLDYNGNGVWDGAVKDRAFTFGWPGAKPVIGDWNGDGKIDIGVFLNGIWCLDSNGNGVLGRLHSRSVVRIRRAWDDPDRWGLERRPPGQDRCLPTWCLLCGL